MVHWRLMFKFIKRRRWYRWFDEYQEVAWQKLDYEAALRNLDKENSPQEWAYVEAKLVELENQRRDLAAKLLPKEA